MTNNLARRLLPFLGWPRVDATSLLQDLGAGIAVSLLAIPQSLAYAQLAGVPTYYGLYAAFIPPIVAVLFGSSALLSTGPVAMTSLLTAASVSHIATPGSAEFISYVTLLALLSGLFQIGLGLARAGVLLNLLSHPVLMGFINAAALIIALSQLPALSGIVVPQTEHFLVDIWHVLARLDRLHGMSVAFGLLAMALLYLFRRFAPRLPGVLIMVMLLTALSQATDFAEHGGSVVGEIPAGMPSMSVPAMSWRATIALLPAAFVIALISFMEAMSSSKVIAIKTRSRWDENQELIGQGLAKVAAAFCHSMPVSGSFSRSALNLASHAKTGFSALFAAGFVLLTLLYFTPLLYHLPKPALAAMIILAVVNLIDFSALRHAWQAGRDDGIAAALSFFATLAFAPNIQNGILTGILFSLGAFIYRRMSPRIVPLGIHGDGVLRDAMHHGLPPLHEKVAALRFDATLFFANVSFFEDAILKLERENPQLEYILVVASGINHIDASAVEMLRGLVRRLGECGITLVFSSAKRQFLEVVQRTGLAAEIGDANLFDSDDGALKEIFRRMAASPRTSPAS
ncbi:MAG: SulP family inorganic anion transporter [Sulfuritalea sp.]|nr:SulP family inorganic anion transporter [Sulfuritalea sp.]MDP1985210.1 SulP family inorganic anion transporter [Sulfuritalea sp.]